MRDLHSIPTRRSSDLWKWRTDPRLRLPSLVRFTEDQLESILQALVAPVLAIRAEQGMVTQAYLDQRSKHIADATIKTVEGRHHFHLEASSAPQVAMHIKEFLQHEIGRASCRERG